MTTTPIVINNINDLQAVQNNLSANYVLGANIDAAGFSFTPIGSVANPFTGIFDGQGHTISNLTINNVSNTDSGLFGDIGATGAVSNVGLINESVTSSYSNVGGIVGENFGTVSQSYVTGNVSGATYVGALVGFNGASGSITQSFATGTANGQIAGGLVGLNGGAISDSYATGAVNYFRVSVEAGGLVGLNSGSITQSYATGPVGNSGGFVLGGLVGGETAGSVTVSYWDTQTTGRSISGGGTGLTTAQLQSGILPAGFDPTIWLDVAGQFPGLRWQVSTDQPPTHDQISPYIYDNTVFDQTSDTAPLAPWFYFFSIGATFSTAGDYSAASATYPGLGSPQSLGLIAPTRFDFGSSAFTSFSALQAAYPFGTYTVTAVGNQISSTNSVSYQANYFTSTIPFVTNYSSLNGLNAANDFTVHYNSFAPDAHVTTGFTFLTIWNATTHQVVFQDDFQSSSSTTAQIPANTLSPNTNYTFELDFSDRLVVGSSTQGFDMRTDGSFTTGPVSTNHPPVASNITSNANEDTNILPVKLMASYTDADLSDTFTFSTDTTGTAGLVTNNHDGTFTYDPNGKLESLGVGETTTDTFTYTVTDNHGASTTASATVTIHGENDSPIAAPDIVSVQKGTTFTADRAHGVLANDTDPDTHDIATLKVSAVNGSSNLLGRPIKGSYGTLTLAADGSYTYAMKSNAPVGAQDVFQYTVADVHGATSVSTLTLQSPYPSLVVTSATLTGSINERPFVTGSGANDAISAQVIAYNVPDPNHRPTATRDLAHQTITWQDGTHDYTSQLTSAEITALASAFSIVQTDNASTGKVTWAYKMTDSALDFLGTGETVTITTPVVIDDHHGSLITENVVVTINGADDKPTVSGPITSTVSEDDLSYAIDLLQFASDPDRHDALHVANVSGLAAGVKLLGDSLQVDPSAYNSTSAGQHATINAKYDVMDGSGGSVAERANITINGANDAPTGIHKISPQNLHNQPYSSVVEIYVHYDDGSAVTGSGVVIGSNSVLTAAHVFYDWQTLGKHIDAVTVAAPRSSGNANVLFTADDINLSVYGDNGAVIESDSHTGSGGHALIQGSNPLEPRLLLDGIGGDPSQDIAVLGVSANLNVPALPISQNAGDDFYTALGFPAEASSALRFLNSDTELSLHQNLNGFSYWRGSFDLAAGMSGGPLLSANNEIVGIFSQEAAPQLLFGKVGYFDRINDSQLQSIQHWVQDDLLLI